MLVRSSVTFTSIPTKRVFAHSTWRHQLKEHRYVLGGLCGKKIYFSPPPPFSLTGGSCWGAYRDTGIMEEYGDMGITEMNCSGQDFINPQNLCGLLLILAEPL